MHIEAEQTSKRLLKDIVPDELLDLYMRLLRIDGCERDEAADLLDGPEQVEVLIREGMALVRSSGPGLPRRLVPVPPDLALQSTLAELSRRMVAEQERLLTGHRRMAETHPLPASMDGSTERLVQIIVDREQIGRVARGLISSARHEWMTLDNQSVERPMDELTAVPPPPSFEGHVRCRAIYESACAEHPVGLKTIEVAVGWQGSATWIPGASHSAAMDVSYRWAPDSSSTPQAMKLGRRVSMDSDIKIAGTTEGLSTPARFADLVNVDNWDDADLEKEGYLNQIRCDNTKIVSEVPTTGCVFHNYVPTYAFNAAKYPQASSHAWLIQHKLPNHPGSKAHLKPLYFLPDGDGSGNRTVICPRGWAAANGDTSALNGGTDRLNCDEFAFNATYNSGGMPALAGGLNPVSSGDACVQTFASKQDDSVHLFDIDGLAPTWNEVCGRSAISGTDNSGSMAAFPGFNVSQRLLDRDPYWLNTNMSADCSSDSTIVKCTMTANNT